MISTLQSSTSTKHTGHLDLVLNPLKVDSSTSYLVHSPAPSVLTARSSLTDISNIAHCSHTITSDIGIFTDNLSSLSLRSRPTMHFSRVATPDRHDTDAWAQEWKVHDSELNAAAVSSSLGSDGTVPGYYFPVDVARSSFAPMELQTERPKTVEQFPSAGRPHDCPFLVSPVWPSVNIAPCSREDLSEGRRRVGEILVRCGVIDVPGMSPSESTSVGYDHNFDTRLVPPVISGVTTELPLGENDMSLITALADWTSEWVHTLVIQPYQGNIRLQCVIQVLSPSDLTFYMIQISGNIECSLHYRRATNTPSTQ